MLSVLPIGIRRFEFLGNMDKIKAKHWHIPDSAILRCIKTQLIQQLKLLKFKKT